MGVVLGVARAAHELALFAVAGFAIGGLDDLLIDLAWLTRAAWRQVAVRPRFPRATAATLPAGLPGRLAVFVPAWREEAVIGAMVATALATLRHPDWRLYVGCYPNDPLTPAEVARAAAGDPRVRVVIGDRAGPTTKAGCLNWLWQAMCADEAADGAPVKAMVLHDAEDVVHRDELAVFAALSDRFAMVQIPVEAVPVRGHGAAAWLVSATYVSEFAEAHGKELVLREAAGAAVPSAGVGTAIRRDVLHALAAGRDGPFDPTSLTEDYELGLKVAAAGGRGVLVRLPAGDGRGIVAVRACFPHRFVASSRQKARWITGIALAGWDRLGWQGGLAERWMRARDRRAPLAALVLACAYAALLLWLPAAAAALHRGVAAPALLPPAVSRIGLALLGWRMLVRAAFTGRSHGVRLALLTPVLMLIGNFVAITAAARAIAGYLGILRTGRVRWDKTAHVFPR